MTNKQRVIAVPELSTGYRFLLRAADKAAWAKYFPDPSAYGVMHGLNGLYVDWYGDDKVQYLNRPDAELWPEAVANSFWALDLDAILHTGEVRGRMEPTPGGVSEYCWAEKLAVPYRDGYMVLGTAEPYDIARDDASDQLGGGNTGHTGRPDQRRDAANRQADRTCFI